MACSEHRLVWGVFVLDSTSWFYFDRRNSGLPFHDVGGMSYDKNGCVWFTMYGGGASRFCGYSYISSFKPVGEAPTAFKPAESAEIRIYPNPATDLVNLALGPETWTSECFDHVGRLLLQRRMTGEVQIMVKGWRAGVYFLRFTNQDGRSLSGKLVVAE